MPFASCNFVNPVPPACVVTVKSEEVAVFASVNAISLALVVVIVLPPLYAPCNVEDDEQVITWLEASTHKGVPVLSARPVNVR